MHIAIRPWKYEDISQLVEYANNKNIAKNLTDQFPHPYTIENGRSFIQMANSHTPTRIFAITLDKKAVGGIGLHLQQDIFCKNAELGYWLAEPFWGKGIVTKAVKDIVTYGFKTFDINRIYARPFGGNIGSQRVLEKAGFILEGRFEKTLYKNSAYHDELVYAIRKT